MFLSSRYKDDEKDMVILRSYEKEYKETRRTFDQEVAKLEFVKEVVLLELSYWPLCCYKFLTLQIGCGRWKILLSSIDIKT